jgi:hypothetical protein
MSHRGTAVEFLRRGCGAMLGRFLQSIHRLDWYYEYIGVDRSGAGRRPAMLDRGAPLIHCSVTRLPGHGSPEFFH